MKKSTMALIVIICLVVITATILSPSISSYFEKNGLNSEISAKTFNIDEINEDKITLRNKNTSYYHFIATSVVGGKKLFFTLQDSVQGSFFTLYRKFEGENDYTKISSSPSGNLIDNQVFGANEKRFYKVEFSSVDDSKHSWKTKTVDFLLYTDALIVKPMAVPQGGMEIERPKNKLVLDGSILLSGASRDNIVVDNLIFKSRTDASDKLLAYAVVAKGSIDLPISLSFTYSTDNKLIFSLNELEGYENRLDFSKQYRASVFVYLPRKFPIETIDVICNGKFNPSNLSASTINLMPTEIPLDNQKITLTANNYSFHNLNILPNAKGKYFTDKITLTNFAGIGGAEIGKIYAEISPTFTPKIENSFENTSLALSSSVNIENVEIAIKSYGSFSTTSLELEANINKLSLSTNGKNNLLCNAFLAKNVVLENFSTSKAILSLGSLESFTLNSYDKAATTVNATDIFSATILGSSSDQCKLSANDIGSLSIQMSDFEIFAKSLKTAKIHSFENASLSIENWNNRVDMLSSFNFKNFYTDIEGSTNIIELSSKSKNSSLSILQNS